MVLPLSGHYDMNVDIVNTDGYHMLTMTTLQRLWRASAPLTAVGILMLVVFAASLAAMAIDNREILGAPAWLKPTKFAISSAIYTFTLAWILTFLPDRTRLAAIVGWITTIVLVVEVGIIDAQAARGVTSHFNAATPLDERLFGIMGMGIAVLFVSAIALTVGLFRQRFADSAFGWALRLGMLLTVMGQATGALMTAPTAARLEVARSTGLKVSGAHTVGAPDGGMGLPFTGWSREHGDLRVPHFVGIHGVQAIPLIAWLIGAGGGDAWRRRAAWLAAAAYYGLFLILLVQALGGHPAVPMMASR
jgi:hypothetical protein